MSSHPVLPSVLKGLRALEQDRDLVKDLNEAIYQDTRKHPMVPITMAQVFELLARHGYNRLPLSPALMFGSVTAVLGTWRLTKGAYLFDEYIWEQISSAPLTRLPCTLLQHLPEPAPLLLFPSALLWEGHQIDAAHAYLDWDSREDPHLELRFLCWVRHQNEHQNLSLVLDLDAETLDQCLERTCQRSLKELPPSDNLVESVSTVSNSIRGLLQALVNATLFLCQEEPDLSDLPRKRPQRPRKFKHLRTPDKPRIIQAGWRWGAALRQYRAQEETQVKTQGPPTGRSVQPHVRRAHWHLYWTGEGSRKDPSKAVPRIKWVGATLVRGEVGVVMVRKMGTS